MVWQKGATLNKADGAGHVAVVEQVISSTQVKTSESGYNSFAFKNRIRTKGTDGNCCGTWNYQVFQTVVCTTHLSSLEFSFIFNISFTASSNA